MKCPKCGFNSFEYNNICKKCSNDLVGYKIQHGIQAIVLPRDARQAMASSHSAEAAEAEHTVRAPETATDMFSFDLPEEGASATGVLPAANGNPFNFDEDSAPAEPPSFYDVSFGEPEKSAQAKAEESAFADLLESTALDGDTGTATPLSSTGAAPGENPGEFNLENFSWDDTSAPAGKASPTSGQEPGEFDLESFSWDDTPAAPAKSITPPGAGGIKK